MMRSHSDLSHRLSRPFQCFISSTNVDRGADKKLLLLRQPTANVISPARPLAPLTA